MARARKYRGKNRQLAGVGVSRPLRLKIIAIYGNIITAKLETSSDERIRSQLRERQRGSIDTP